MEEKRVSAQDFSWSYAAWLSMSEGKAGLAPGSWGALDASRVRPKNCSVVPPTGTYQPALFTAWPRFPCKPVEKAQITFHVLVRGVKGGEEVSLYGNVPELGAWNGRMVPKMEKGRFDGMVGSELWRVSVEVEAGRKVKYKYRVETSGVRAAESKNFELEIEKGDCWYAQATCHVWDL